MPELSSPPVLTGAVPLLSEVTHAPPGLPLPQYNIAEYMGHNAWPANIIVSPINQPLEVNSSVIVVTELLIYYSKILLYNT